MNEMNARARPNASKPRICGMRAAVSEIRLILIIFLVDSWL